MKTQLRSFEDALRLVLDAAPAPKAELIPIGRASGRTLARDIRADRDIPPFDRSALDGYAVRVKGRFGSRRRLPVIGEVAAGARPPRELKEGACVRIWTGAAVPPGAQGVIPVERAREEDGWVELDGPLDRSVRRGRGRPRRPGVADRGEDALRGDLVARSGERITPGSLAVLAAVGVSQVPVWSEPDLAIAVTGHEVVPSDRKPTPVQIRNSNEEVVAAIAASAGVRSAARLGIVEDDASALLRVLLRGLDHDVLVVTGGVSAGRLDLVPAVLEGLGVRIVVHKAAIRPGKPFLFGVMEHGSRRRAPRGGAARRGGGRRTFVFGLPGNPVSVLVTAIEFLAPFLRACRGEAPTASGSIPVRIERPVSRGGGLTHFVPCTIAVDAEGTLWAREIDIRGSGDFVSASRADALLRVPGDGRERKRGSILLADSIQGGRGSWDLSAAPAKGTIAAARTRRA